MLKHFSVFLIRLVLMKFVGYPYASVLRKLGYSISNLWRHFTYEDENSDVHYLESIRMQECEAFFELYWSQLNGIVSLTLT